jgi:hypothetical protein
MTAKKNAPAPHLPASPALPGEADYTAIHAAVLATERGRWFLAEYARRNRQADAAELLAAVERVGAASLGAATPDSSADQCRDQIDPERLRTELAEMAGAIARAVTELSTAHEPAAAEAKGRPAKVPQAHEVAPAVDMATAAREIDELAWTMREQGFEADFCDRLDRHAAVLQHAGTSIGEHWQRAALDVLADLAARVHAVMDSIGATPSSERAPPVQDNAATNGAVDAPGPRPHDAPAATPAAPAAPLDGESRLGPSQAMNGPIGTDANAKAAPLPAMPPVDSGPPPAAAAGPASCSSGTPQGDEPTRSAEVPQRAGSELSEDPFADVMALSEEERIALFT